MNIIESLYSIIRKSDKEMRYAYRMTNQIFNSGQAYGIEVERQDVVDGNVIKIERDEIKLISNNENKVRELLDLLYKNQVSPIHLVEILGEYVDEYIYDFDRVEELCVLN
ncbi:DUF6514 family protein [Clostridium carnis]